MGDIKMADSYDMHVYGINFISGREVNYSFNADGMSLKVQRFGRSTFSSGAAQ